MDSLKGKVALMALVGALAAAPASATTISAVAGAVTVDSFDTTTVGSSADPWTLNETITGGFAMVAFTSEEAGEHALGDNSTGSLHSFGKWLSKTIVNNSGIAWTSFELELRVVPEEPSLDGDGLSFAQGSGFEGTFTSDKFGTYTAIEDIRDYLNFHNGVVLPGESVTFLIAMTDNTLREQFFLLQTPNRREVTNEVPEPASMFLLGAGLVGASARRLRKNRAKK